MYAAICGRHEEMNAMLSALANRVDTAMPIYPQAIRPQMHQITSRTATENRIYVDEHWRVSGVGDSGMDGAR